MSKEKLITIEVHIDCDPRCRVQLPVGNLVFKLLDRDYVDPDYTLFGDWVWTIKDVTKRQQKKIGDLLLMYYNAGMARYVAWREKEP